MNHGYLKLMVVQQLLHEPTTGYALVKIIQEKTGWKPSWGSIYPMLAHFEHDGFVAVKQDGKKKVYTLTAKGKQTLGDTIAVREHAHQQIVEQLKLLASLGDKHCEFALRMLQVTHAGKISAAELPEALAVREELLRLTEEQKIATKAKHIKEILSKTLVELKQL